MQRGCSQLAAAAERVRKRDGKEVKDQGLMNKKKKTNQKGYFNERNIVVLSGVVRGKQIG